MPKKSMKLVMSERSEEVQKARKYTSEYLTKLYHCMCNTRTSIIDQYSPEEMIKLFDAHLACQWDFTIDQWTPKQREDCLKYGLIPEWDDNEQPIEAKKIPAIRRS